MTHKIQGIFIFIQNFIISIKYLSKQFSILFACTKVSEFPSVTISKPYTDSVVLFDNAVTENDVYF